MGLNQETVYTVQCDRAGCRRWARIGWDTDTLIPTKFYGLREILEELRDPNLPEDRWWQIEFPDGPFTCPRCLCKDRCAADGGHDWGGWIINHYGGRQMRRCLRKCGAVEHSRDSVLEKEHVS